MDLISQLWQTSGISLLLTRLDQVVMMIISIILIYLAISKKFEPLLLLPIGFAGLLSNIPGAEIATQGGLLYLFHSVGISTGAFP